MRIKSFNQTIDRWIKELKEYDFKQLCAKPSSNSWSMGQVGMHLIENTNYFIEQIKICMATDDNANEEASPEAKQMFQNNDFPNEILEGPPSNLKTPQPQSKEALLSGLKNLKNEIDSVAVLISASQFKGKTKHPGLNYFNASEWFQFSEMHFRHHLRQKKRIDEFLKMNKNQFREKEL